MPSMKEMIASKKYHLQYFSTRSVSQEILCMSVGMRWLIGRVLDLINWLLV